MQLRVLGFRVFFWGGGFEEAPAAARVRGTWAKPAAWMAAAKRTGSRRKARP